MTAGTAGAQCATDIAALLRARNPLLWCVTKEEARTERILLEACSAAYYRALAWDCATGLTRPGEGVGNTDMTDPNQALAYVRDTNSRFALVMRDLPPWLRDPTVVRMLRSLCRSLPTAPRDNARAIIIVSPSSDVPAELQGHAKVIDIPLPDRVEIAQILDAAIAALPEAMRAEASPNGKRDAAIDAALGLTAEDAQSTFAHSLIVHKRIDPVAVGLEKKRVISRERILEWFDPLAAGLDGVGGLVHLKAWLIERRSAFTPAAREYGLPAPRGVLLAGVPGCGKSLCAKAIAAAWQMPLLRMDMGALKSKFVGESEGNIRKALKVAETVAPCILWIDEIEKALAGATDGGQDGGVSTDALGTMLTWMQERTGAVFVVATANDAWKLPAPLMRRFDDIFFVDLPTCEERIAILGATLRERGRKVADCDIVANATKDFSGAELAKIVDSAMFAAFADGKREITVDDLLRAASSIVPVAKTANDQVTRIRQWAQGRARPASASEAKASGGAVALDIGE